MALKSELMACGMTAALAHRMGYDPPANFVSAGNANTNATTLKSNHAICTTTGASQGVIIGDAFQMWFMQNSDGANAILVYPPIGNNFSGLAVNASISVPITKSLAMYPGGPTGIAWDVSN